MSVTDRSGSACSCVHTRLLEIDRLLTEAQNHVRQASAALDDPDQACRAMELLRLAAQKRADAHAEARAGLRDLIPPTTSRCS